VIYDTRDAWADKNNDALGKEAQLLLEEAPGNPYIRRVLRSDEGGASAPAAPMATRRKLERRGSALFQR